MRALINRKKKKNIHMIIITTSRFDLILRHDRMVTSKETTLTTHSRIGEQVISFAKKICKGYESLQML